MQQEPDGMAEQAFNSFSQQTGEKPVVLVVDDSRVVRLSLRNILKDHCHLIEAEDGEQAWQHISSDRSIDMVFSDLSMPNLDGRSLLAKLRKAESKPIADLPFIVVTGIEATHEITEELENLGASGIVNKPFDPEQIKNFVIKLATQHREETPSAMQPSDTQADSLDNAVDRSQFMAIASRELSFAIRNKNELALALVTIDQFTTMLEHYSEAAIEHILLTIRDIVQQHIHPDDTLAYFGEGCFAILRPASNAIGTRYLGRRILEDLAAKQFYLGESDQMVSASMGISAPDIKPGTRLKDLLLLAEGRLKAAMENGGDKVVDKGNENLTPVPLQNSSELSNLISSQQSDTPHSLSRSPTEIRRLEAEQTTEIKVKYSVQTPDTDDQFSQIAQYKQSLEELTAENRALIKDVEHWKKESSEAEQLRRQLFEVESQFQQLNVKFSDTQAAKNELVQRNEAIERENQRLIEEEEERTTSLRQSHQIVESENNRLESQIQELIGRAEKAELESLKSNQLISSLRENNQLLHMQLDQLQQQLNETQERQRQENLTRTEEQTSILIEQSSDLQSDTDLLNDIYKSELVLTATPENNTTEKDSATSAPLFAKKDQPAPKPKAVKSFKFPPFRVEPEPLIFKERFNLSSFTIASIILLVLLSIGGTYLYLVMSEELPIESVETHQGVSTKVGSQRETRMLLSTSATPAAQRKVNNSDPPNPLNSQPPMASQNTETPDASQTIASKESRQKKEWLLRQMAEEEFLRRIYGPFEQTPQKE
jgi:diguanylate cyclase (GGDEF)-like protein